MGGEGSVRRGAGVTDPLCLPFANFFVCYPSNSSFIEGRSYGEKVCPPHNFLFFNFYLLSNSVKNLGVYLDSHLTMEAHVNNLCRCLYFHLRRIRKIRSYLSLDAAKKLAVSFVLSRLDYCNSLLFGITEEKLTKLQRIQNTAARIVLRQPKRTGATSLLRTLHWLPVKARIEYKVATLCFHTLHTDSFPPYLSELILPYTPARSLRSENSSLLSVPRYSLNSFGKRSEERRVGKECSK